jgi:hypothetical protein
MRGYWKVCEGTLVDISSCKKLQYLNLEGCVQLSNEVGIPSVTYNKYRFCIPLEKFQLSSR